MLDVHLGQLGVGLGRVLEGRVARRAGGRAVVAVALDGAQHVEAERALARVLHRPRLLGGGARLVEPAQLHQRPGVLARAGRPVQRVVVLEHLELVLVLLHLAGQRRDRQQQIAVEAPWRLIGPARGREAPLVQLARAALVVDGASQRALGLVQHPAQHVVAGDRVRIGGKHLLGQPARGDRLALVDHRHRLALARAHPRGRLGGGRIRAALLSAHHHRHRQRGRQRERAQDAGAHRRSAGEQLHALPRVAAASRSSAPAQHSRMSAVASPAPGATSMRWLKISLAVASMSSAVT